MTDQISIPAIEQTKDFFVGDLCYVMHPEWDEFCALTIQDGEVKDGDFSLADGRKFSFAGTKYGDGFYTDQHRRGYPVDAGLIGVIAVEDITESERRNLGNGQVVQFNSLPSVRIEDDGTIFVGGIRIQTGYDDYDEE